MPGLIPSHGILSPSYWLPLHVWSPVSLQRCAGKHAAVRMFGYVADHVFLAKLAV